MDEYREACIHGQREYCWQNDKPLFMPKDGHCPHCGRDLFDQDNGIPLMVARHSLITSCPFCHKSFLD